jgi:sugar fermentation stimulation protein A
MYAMRIPLPTLEGRLLRRYKRFLADIELADGSVVTAHCPNTGSLLGCTTPGSRVILRDAGEGRRKLRYTFQSIAVGRSLVNVDTSLPNAAVLEAIERGRIPELAGYDLARREVRYGARSRIDILLERQGGERCYVEVKSTTLARGRTALFPDAVTERGRRHLEELARMVALGHRAVQFFFVGRGDVARFAPADDIDPAYGRALREAVLAGVEVFAWAAVVRPDRLEPRRPLPVELGGATSAR